MEERKRILEMLKEGKITTEEANELLDALGDEKEEKAIFSRKKTNVGAKFRIIVNSADGDKVNICVPLKLAKMAHSLLPKDVILEMNEAGVNIDEVLKNLGDYLDEFDTDIVNVESASGDLVRIFIEK